MRFTSIFLVAASIAGVMSQDTQTCGDLNNQESLLSCVALPLSTICTGSNSVSCACSQLAFQTDCAKTYCGGTVPSSQLSIYTRVCGGGEGGGSTPATTTAASGATATAGGSGQTSTPAATKNAAMMGSVPMGEILVVAVVAVAYL